MPTTESQLHIEAPPAQVWALISDMSRMGEWMGPITRVELIPGGRAGVGVIRQIHAPAGIVMEERFTSWDEGRAYTYELVKEPWPLRSYSSWVRLEPEGGGSRLVYGASWELTPGPAGAAAGVAARAMIRQMQRGALRRARRRLTR